ncbi:DUF3017 domain-containing protein [Planobispora longispora]|uniref:DUF3017 domain-containing protein n=1 Tax=Planobispora longispora TaxID=28887 RepID=A0A8J3REM4_9ACTN|nr:DUF3017 domain-containing protein [Planobispora longispora]BFE86429.1 hypothetical protein GCM10020093_090300 [Planobispora longispora]GIH74317.1 hypothetical protein Plo01_07460 [Planobispora longispora]
MNRTDNRWGPYPLVLAGAVLAVAYAALAPEPNLYWGGFGLGALIALGALIRLIGGGGRLAVRKKATDVVTLGLFGVALMAASVLLILKDEIPL